MIKRTLSGLEGGQHTTNSKFDKLVQLMRKTFQAQKRREWMQMNLNPIPP
jgi:hypothetical protein